MYSMTKALTFDALPTTNIMGTPVSFDLEFDYNKLRFAESVDEGWKMAGEYSTETDSEGKHYLSIKSELVSPKRLEGNRNHKAEMFVGNILEDKVEWFQCKSSLKQKKCLTQ